MPATLHVPTDDAAAAASSAPELATLVAAPRRHDLDALRAIAMLLGIALHGAISFIPMPGDGWPVQDVQQNTGFAVFMGMIHGFRMPLFFLISGFFTAMLWRRRGLAALFKQRFKRIVLPLFIGMFTIVPAVWVAIIGAGIYQAQARTTAPTTLWSAAKAGNLEAIHAAFLTDGAQLNQTDANFGATPLSMAVWSGNLEAAKTLIDAGAEANARNRDGATPLFGAALFGHDLVFSELISRGADPTLRDRLGRTAIDSLDAPGGITLVLAGLLGVTKDPHAMFEGRKEIARDLQDGPAIPTQGTMPIVTANELGKIEHRQQTATSSLVWLMLSLFPLFHHLWFLWFLCWLVAAFAIYALVMDRRGQTMPAWLSNSPLRYVWLIPATFVPQAMMGMFGSAFGADTSTGLVPQPQILLYYAIFFFFGAIYFDADDRDARLGRRWYLTLPLALLIVFPIAYDMATGAWGLTDQWINSRFYRPVAVVLQVLYTWLMCFGLMGVFRRVYSQESKTMRYVSDSSYWLYLAHLPLIIAIQAVVIDWPMPAIVKFTLVCGVTTAILLLTYQLFIRYTPIGTLLNGPRKRPAKPEAASVVAG